MTLLERLTALMQPYAPRVQKMFGGTAFMLHENLVIGTHKDGLIVRVGPDGMAKSLALPGASAMVMGGRQMQGWVLVAPEGCADESLTHWVSRGLEFNQTLPPAAAKMKPRKTSRPPN